VFNGGVPLLLEIEVVYPLLDAYMKTPGAETAPGALSSVE
jgi:hypothetical protein